MYSSIIIALALLLLSAFVLAKFIDLPRNIWLLFISQPLVMASMPVIVFIGGIVSANMTDNESLATLPITLMILGVAASTIPASIIAKLKGRKFAAHTGFIIALLASLIAAQATLKNSFLLFSLASLAFGASSAFIQQLRFAAIESSPSPEAIPKVLSILMLSGLFAAFLGPEIAVAGKDLITSPYGFSGSFLLLAGLSIISLAIMTLFKNPEVNEEKTQGATRSLLSTAKQPIFIIAILASAIGYALMSYLMTATPMSMHHVNGHSLEETKWVIQSHIAAMFLPSLFTTVIVKKWGLKSLLFVGTCLYAAVIVIALSGQHVMHYWWALLLLGVGWNFLFLVGNSLLPQSYEQYERHKVQALNDFILFGFQAVSSLLAGWILFQAGWTFVVLSSIPFVMILFLVSFYYAKKYR